MAIDLNTIKKMPPKAKILAVCVILFLIGYLYWFYFLSSAMEKRSTLSQKLKTMQEQINEKTKVAKQIDKYKADVEALQENYKIALQKLPDQREIPALFHSVASAGKDAGIEFLLFEPKPPVPKAMDVGKEPKTSELLKPSDQRTEKKPPAAAAKKKGKEAVAPEPEPFYEEIPVEISVIGTFQNTLLFFDKVAKLPRIVNISDITLGEKEARGKAKTQTTVKGNAITSSGTIKTYMFIDKKDKTPEPVTEQKSKQASKKTK
jgi:type IV pilus assembly protein PilO